MVLFLFSRSWQNNVVCGFNLSSGTPVICCLLLHLTPIFLKGISQFPNVNILASKRRIVKETKGNVRGAVCPFLIILSIGKTKMACFCLWLR